MWTARKLTIMVSLAVLAATAGVALAAPPLPKPAKAYQTKNSGLGSKNINLTYVTSASSGKVIEPGEAALGSNFAVSQVFLPCPSAPRNRGLKGDPFVDFAFPGATFKLTHARYAFTKKLTVRKLFILGSPAKPFTLKVTLTATVAGSTTITGTLKATGGRCSTHRALPYTAKLNPKLPVAPGK